jgi:CheY-like chemotaxis protein
MIKKSFHHFILFAIGLDLFAIIWLFSASMGTYIFHNGTFIEQAFTPPLITIGIRAAAAIVVIGAVISILRKDEQAADQNTLPLTSPPITLLVMLEDPSLGRLIRDTLLPLGYSVFEASCVDEAFKLSNSLQEDIDYLIIDMDMADINGQKMAETIQFRLPWVQVVYMSSDGAILLEHGNRSGSIPAIIPKPAVPNRLADSMRKVMNTDDDELKQA